MINYLKVNHLFVILIILLLIIISNQRSIIKQQSITYDEVKDARQFALEILSDISMKNYRKENNLD